LSDSNGILWIGSTNNGLYKAEIKGRVSKVTLVPNVTIHDIIEDRDGNIWLASDGQGVFKIKDDLVENFTIKSGLAGNMATSLAVDEENTVYAASVNGLNAIKGKEVISYSTLQGTIINDLLPDEYGMLWIGSDKGLMRFRPSDNRLEIFDESQGLPGNRISDLCFDHEGSLWVGGYETGLVRFKQGMITNITLRDGLSTNQVYSVGSHNGVYYVGTQDGKINVISDHDITQLELEPRFQEDAIRGFLFDKDVIWVWNYMGLARIAQKTVTYYHEGNGLPANSIRKMFKSTDGTYWLATRAGGLIKFNPNGQHEVLDKNKGMLTNYILSLAEDSQGNLLMGTNAGGLSILTPSGVLENYNINGNDSGTIIFSVRPDGENIWLSTNLGLYLFRNGTFTLCGFDGLKTQKFFDLIYDQTDSYWLTSSIGVIKLLKRDVDAFIAKEIATIPYIVFGEEDGMESQECTGATAAMYDHSSGSIWVPTYEGVAIIKPAQKILNDKKPRVLITGMQVDNNLINPVENDLVIQPGNFRYLFDVTALSFLAPSKVQFKYRLEGIEDEWNGPTNKRRIEYTNLPYGTYTLHVIASNNDGVWNMEGDTLSFKVKPFYFETMWFRWGLVILLVGSLYALYRWRVRDIRKTNKALTKMNAELDRFVYSASHDLRGPLTTIMGVLDMAIAQNKDSGHDGYFRMIKTNTDKMDHFINELINYAKNKNDVVMQQPIKLALLVNDVIAELAPFSQQRGVRIENQIAEGFQITTDEQRLRVIIRNLLHNAIAFSKDNSQDSLVLVRAAVKDGATQISVKDKGVGISHKIKDKIFDMFYRGNDQSQGSGLGLYVVRDTTEKLNAIVEVKSKPEEGSEFIVSFRG
jgi:signal transduction histidine kinase/sugar lactone lactonase YvrE